MTGMVSRQMKPCMRRREILHTRNTTPTSHKIRRACSRAARRCRPLGRDKGKTAHCHCPALPIDTQQNAMVASVRNGITVTARATAGGDEERAGIVASVARTKPPAHEDTVVNKTAAGTETLNSCRKKIAKPAVAMVLAAYKEGHRRSEGHAEQRIRARQQAEQRQV